jgi:ATP-dependent DNA helicase RecQ
VPDLAPVSADHLAHLLKQVFGYDRFRPLQREIIDASLAGRDALAVLPTGAGKSLCFQLPALAYPRPALTIVVSPLIALMKDQVDQLSAAGVSATFLNSSLGADEAKRRFRGLYAGEYKLLYVAPERLMLDGFTERLKEWAVRLIAVDEAHCISEWGHDFRPEYRQLAKLRELLPTVPVMGLTATATPRVRDDIVKHLALREPAVFVASFNRPNLTYRVETKDEPIKQLLAFLKERPHDAGIVYCASRKQTEKLADSLNDRGIAARAYHAGLEAAERTRNQEAFLRDEIRVVCATIAFGMGINKPNVRFVVHYDLPKNVEGYYQETGRAGRDGLPADCLLLYSAGDAAKQRHFIDEITDEAEKARARRQLRQMLDYADTTGCRRVELMRYFGETFQACDCGACDNCLAPLETYDATLPAQKLLSCVYRIRAASGFDMGLKHVVDVLRGHANEKTERLRHDALSTWGIGADKTEHEWMHLGREMLRLGYVELGSEGLPVVGITDAGRELLRTRTAVTLAKPRAVVKPKRDRKVRDRRGDFDFDEILFERLRELRKKLADERDVPAYIVFGDTSLREMARYYPGNVTELSGISGVGEKKLNEFGDTFLGAIRAHLAAHGKQDFGG